MGMVQLPFAGGRHAAALHTDRGTSPVRRQRTGSRGQPEPEHDETAQSQPGGGPLGVPHDRV